MKRCDQRSQRHRLLREENTDSPHVMETGNVWAGGAQGWACPHHKEWQRADYIHTVLVTHGFRPHRRAQKIKINPPINVLS